MRGYAFAAGIDPNRPLDSNDPPPADWYDGIDTSDYRKALFGTFTRVMRQCVEWESRELARAGLLPKTGVIFRHPMSPMTTPVSPTT
jgi:hypothetical protein